MSQQSLCVMHLVLTMMTVVNNEQATPGVYP